MPLSIHHKPLCPLTPDYMRDAFFEAYFVSGSSVILVIIDASLFTVVRSWNGFKAVSGVPMRFWTSSARRMSTYAGTLWGADVYLDQKVGVGSFLVKTDNYDEHLFIYSPAVLAPMPVVPVTQVSPECPCGIVRRDCDYHR